MGRRPNPVVSEFFERGAKLDDSSNRYEHTCKRCGEEFPKGRIDSLTSHLLRKCPNITEEDRQWVYQQTEENSDRRASRTKSPVRGLPPHIRQEDLESQIPLGAYQQHQQGQQQQQVQPPSALDTLAEVSRLRHLDYSSQRTTTDQEPRQKSLGELLAEQNLLAELQQHGIFGTSATYPDFPNLTVPTTVVSSQQQQTPVASFVTGDGPAASSLVQAASAANEQLEQAQIQHYPEVHQVEYTASVDPQLHEGEDDIPTEVNDSTINASEAEPETMTWNPTNTRIGEQTFGNLSLPPNEAASGFGLLKKVTHNKKRGRFDDTRRKEVKEIRKQGACIRCRMLKKPCSGETPCSTCKVVDSARLWKATCTRKRLADAFSLWSTNLFYSKARVDTPTNAQGLQNGILPCRLPGRIEARFFSSSDLAISFPAKAYDHNASAMDSSAAQAPPNQSDETTHFWLLDDSENMTFKVSDYVTQTISACTEGEPSQFIRTTLQQALTLIQAEGNEQAAKSSEGKIQSSPRSCYNIQDHLLTNIVELWVLTVLLACPHRHILQIQHNASEMSQLPPQHVNWDNQIEDSSVQQVSYSSLSYRLIQSQLAAAIESRCSKLAKTIMNELERRLLRRQQVSRFETVLSAVILLNCVERMTGLYRRFDNGDQLSSADATTQSNEQDRSQTMEAAWGEMHYRISDNPSSWPLDMSPSDLWREGPKFADLLVMLLRMRALPPRVVQNADGTLAVMQNHDLPVQVNGQSTKGRADEMFQPAAAWLDPLRMSAMDLVKVRDGPEPGHNDSMEAWDMRFIAKVLVPEQIR